MPKLGGKKLYYLLQSDLSELNVRRDKISRILRHMLIMPKKRDITTDLHYRFRKRKNLVDSMKIEVTETGWVSDKTYVGNRHNLFYLALTNVAY
jgi:putative transposase